VSDGTLADLRRKHRSQPRPCPWRRGRVPAARTDCRTRGGHADAVAGSGLPVREDSIAHRGNIVLAPRTTRTAATPALPHTVRRVANMRSGHQDQGARAGHSPNEKEVLADGRRKPSVRTVHAVIVVDAARKCDEISSFRGGELFLRR